MTVIIITLLAFIIPVLIYLRIEWKKQKEAERKYGEAARKKEPLDPAAIAKVTLVLILLTAIPALVFSAGSYSFYGPGEAYLKVGFKHTGKRIADCGESDMITREGERYRKELEGTKQVRMNVEAIARCPRERHPVYLRVWIDDKAILDRAYAPTGLKKDMASYIYGEYRVEPGPHTIKAMLFDKGNKDAPDHVLEEAVEINARDIKLLTYDPKAEKLVIE